MIFVRTLYFFLPLLVAAALSAVVQRLDLFRILKRPMDLGVTLRGKRLFGDNKTWRGFVVAIVGSIAGTTLQRFWLAPHVGWLAVVDYSRINLLAFGFAMGAGAILGELPNSFVKRRLDVAPGATSRGPSRILFFVWDQVDSIVLTWPMVLWWYRPSLAMILVSLVLALGLHPLLSVIGYLTGARRNIR